MPFWTLPLTSPHPYQVPNGQALTQAFWAGLKTRELPELPT
jgi:hypothetical protein